MPRKLSLAERAAQLSLAMKAERPEAGRYAVANNLYLNVSKTGAKSWVFMWQAGGTRREMGLGSFNGAGSTEQVTLTAAKKKADRARVQIDAGIDPIAEKHSLLAGLVTFAGLMTKFIDKEAAGWKANAGQRQEWERTRDSHCKLIANRAVSSITTHDVMSVIEPIWAENNPTARRVLKRIENVIDYAIASDRFFGKNPARFDGHIEHLVGKVAVKVESHAMLSYVDAPALVEKLRSFVGLSSQALAFTILTAVRSANTIGMRWSEVNWDAATWTIPAERMKVEERDGVAVAHIVPLSTAALAILEQVKGLDPVVVFPGGSKDGTLAPGAMNEKLCKPRSKGGLDYAGKATVHGMRATFATWINEETRFPSEEREFALAHVKAKEVAAYQRGTSVEKRREMMQAWANYLEGRTNVSALRVAA